MAGQFLILLGEGGFSTPDCKLCTPMDTTTGTRKESTSSLEGNNEGSTSSSVIDLLLSMTKGRRSVSSSDIVQWVADAGDDEIDQFDREEVSFRNITEHLHSDQETFYSRDLGNNSEDARSRTLMHDDR